MKLSPGFALSLALCLLAALSICGAQTLPASLSFTTRGTFLNGVEESTNSVLIADNDLTNGHRSGFDLIDAPASMLPTGPLGAAAFQWGVAADSSVSSSYLHPSALWFQPLAANNIAPEQLFDLGYLYYRNGTIKTNTGATSVDLALTMSFSTPVLSSPVETTFTQSLINTKNTNDLVESADIVSLGALYQPLDFTDSFGNRYFLEMTFAVDQDTIDNTLSSANQFRVFEGSQGRATLQGKFTTTPTGFSGTLIPEPSSALLTVLGSLALLRRRR